MGVRPESFGRGEMRFILPLENNLNDKGTAFGGSTSAAMIVAGWSLVYLHLQSLGIHADVVIYRNRSRWLRPLNTDATVVARWQAPALGSMVTDALFRMRRQRVSCDIEVVDMKGQVHSQMQADYVILPSKTHGETLQQGAG